jgi:hypothetical protein
MRLALNTRNSIVTIITKQMSKFSFFIFFNIAMIFFGGCTEKNTEDPVEVYNLWSGEMPTKDVEVVHGKYWQSSHWSKEYIMYLELKASSSWRKKFIKQNSLIEDKKTESIPSDAPLWFKPGVNLRTLKQSGFNQGSVYYEDTISGKMFIYEIQL